MSTTELIVNGRTVEDGALVYFSGVPFGFIRPIFQVLGGTVAWQSRENQVVVTWHSNFLLIPATGNGIILNGQPRTFAEAHRTVDGRLCVSLADLAAVFLGTLRPFAEQLHLFLPTGLLTGLTITRDSLVINWTGQVEHLTTGEDPAHGLSLLGASWALPIGGLVIKQSEAGHLVVNLDTDGRPLDIGVGEQSLRLAWKTPQQKLEGLVVALDAGHGGQQPGAVGVAGTLEKVLARQVVDLLSPRLREAGAEVVDIRPGDETVSLAERVRRTRVSKAELFVSIHYNAHENRSAHGTETFHATGNVEAASLALFVQGELVAALGLRDRGVKQAAFHVIRAQPEIPSILVEIGFLTNPTEEQFLLRYDTLQKTADALYAGICRYVESREKQRTSR
ncbi:MAG: N-acetylmuramoyl-L-alanine amidase [Firmicutes bacterium]|nr:N-acetylmuramoyl-L-alanine amidase [Dethiobacter sp.]MBS3889174.1 N-acetylmuramoyl-L-alanine amidase [Bacillota bacterium]